MSIEVNEKDLEDVSKLSEAISDVLVNSKMRVDVCHFTLLRILILGSYKMKIPKGRLLNLVSEEWELFDDFMENSQNDYFA